MHERYILPALAPLALVAALLRPAPRLPFVLLSAAVFLNLIHVLPLTRAQIQLMERLPDIRIWLSLVNTALLVWWTWLFPRPAPVGIVRREAELTKDSAMDWQHYLTDYNEKLGWSTSASC